MKYELHHGDCLEVMAAMDANSVDAIVTDPPYFKVKDLDWDRQWDTPQGFISWLNLVLAEFERVLKPNGSLYLFASPQMSWHVEGAIRDRFCVLNSIRWVKEGGNLSRRHMAQIVEKDLARSFLSNWESIIFAEHYGSDNMAKGEAGYAAKCDELRGFVFEPLRAYLDEERVRAGVTVRQVAEAFQQKTKSRTVTGMAGHWFSSLQWVLPTEENYRWLRSTLSRLDSNGAYLRREYEELRREYEELRREYEELRREYEELRRPFNVSADVPYTDVWTYKTVGTYNGKHPCEKPLDMMEHIIKASTREGDTVLDAFMGSGSTGEAAVRNGRKFIGIDADPRWVNFSNKRIARSFGAFGLEWKPVVDTAQSYEDMPLFAGV